MTPVPGRSPDPRRVLLLGATGTIGRAAAVGLIARGHAVTAIVRPGRDPVLCDGIDLRHADVTDPASLARDGIRGDRFDALVSCLASRTGAPADAWAIDHRAHLGALDAARTAGVRHFVLLSAICVQKPRLAFQQAKLAFEQALIGSGLDWTIVRPTAYFKSLAGQIARVRDGRPFLIFGDGRMTACKPVSDRDLAAFLADCLDDPARRNRILPIGGPGPAITPLAQGEILFRLTGRAPRFRSSRLLFLMPSSAASPSRENCRRASGPKPTSPASGATMPPNPCCFSTPRPGGTTPMPRLRRAATGCEDFYARVLSGAETVNLGDHAVF